MAKCIESVNQLIEVKARQSELNQRIANFDVSQTDLQMPIVDKISVLKDIYQTRKEILDIKIIKGYRTRRLIDSLADVEDKKLSDNQITAVVECLYDKLQENEELTLPEIIILYRILKTDCPLSLDKKISELSRSRDKKEDLSRIYGCSKEQISLTSEEALNGGMKFHYGDLNLDYIEEYDDGDLPEVVSGDVDLTNFTDSRSFKFPRRISGNLYLDEFTDIDNAKIEWPEFVGGRIFLDSLSNPEKQKFRLQHPKLADKVNPVFQI
jgi:hypothetical protein